MLNKNTLAVKKVRGQSEAASLQIGKCDQKLWYQLRGQEVTYQKIFLTT